MNDSITVLGIMSGSSLDGVDLACIRFYDLKDSPQRPSVEWIQTIHHSYDQHWITKLSNSEQLSTKELLHMHVEYANYMGSVIQKLDIDFSEIDLIGWHGHTIYHNPKQSFSFQLGRGDVLCTSVNRPVVCDFRNQDMAAGGQGAPLAPIVDHTYFKNYSYLINLGGIANITVNKEIVSAFDLCGFNQVLNYLAQKLGKAMDKDGHISKNGKLNAQLRSELNQWDYLEKAAPKSLSNQEVQSFYFKLLNQFEFPVPDKMKTFLVHVCDTIEKAIPNDEECTLLLSGGGSNNVTFTELLSKRLKAVVRTAKAPWLEYKEAFLMAYMAYLRWSELPNVIASATGSKKDQSIGVIYQ